MLRLKGLIGKDVRLTKEQTAEIFERRYKMAFWLILLPFVLFALLGYASSKFGNDDPNSLFLFWLSAFFFFIAFFSIMFMYRCPRCGEYPYGTQIGAVGLRLIPKKCGKCQAPLLPNYRLGQD